MILADTSAWVEYDRATGSPVDQRLTELIATDGSIAVTDPSPWRCWPGRAATGEKPICGACSYASTCSASTPSTDFDAAARIYRRCRHAGITPRGMVDCMIASVARRRGAALLAHDDDLEGIARVVGIDLDEASLRG